MNTNSTVKTPFYQRKHRGFILATCFSVMALTMLLSALLLAFARVDSSAHKLEDALFQSDSVLLDIGNQFARGSLTGLNANPNGDSIYAYDHNGGQPLRKGSYQGRYTLLFQFSPDYPGLTADNEEVNRTVCPNILTVFPEGKTTQENAIMKIELQPPQSTDIQDILDRAENRIVTSWAYPNS